MPSRATVAALLLAALAGCQETPTSVLLRIEAGSGLPSPDELRLSVLEEPGVAVNDRRIPESGAPTLPGTLVLYPRPSSATIRVLCRARKAGQGIGEGVTTVALQAGAQVSAAVILIPGRLPDSDGDGVPDAIDNCPALANPAQAPCSRPDAAADGRRDGAADRALDAVPETAPDARRDLAPADAAPDARTPDTRSPDGKPPDTRPHDGKPPDTRPPDTKPPDAKPPPKITVTAPSPGVWAAGTTHTIQWSTTGTIPTVTIDLYRAGTKVSTIATGIANTGTRSWSIPATLSYASSNVVRVADATAPAVYGESAPFTIANWRFAAPVTINATGVASNLVNYQVLVTLTSSFDYASAKSDGSDLRFSTGSSLGATFLPHHLESWKAGSPQKSKLWVRVPQILGGGNTTIYLFYGNTAAGSTSSLATTFPQSFVSTGDLTLSGSQSYDRFELVAGHTLKLLAGAPLTISARQILIAGSVDGLGAGHPGGALGYLPGQGPGGGGALNIEGAGGGGHGGAGGAGGHDAAAVAPGGVANGSATDETNAMGSGGGSTEVVGAAGGGALALVATDLLISGAFSLAGAAGTMSSPGRGTGGGAGGGLLLKGDLVSVASALGLGGGDGGTSTSVAYDGGGGGGGGRYKVFYQSSYSPSGATIGLAGGAGGCPTSPIPQLGLAGATGTAHTQQKSLGIPTTSVGAGAPL